MEILFVWKRVFSNAKYLILGAAAFLLFYMLNVFVINFKNIISIYSAFEFKDFLVFLFSLIIDFKKSLLTSSFVFLIVIGLLFGILVSLISFKINSKMSKNLGFLGGLGVFLGIFAPGCAACGVGLVSLMGLSAGFLSFFPFEGAGLSILSIIIFCIAIFKISKDLTICEVCKVDFKYNKIYKVKGGKK